MALVRTVSVLLGVKGQEDVKAKLEQVKLRADELAKMDPTIKVDIDTAAAEAKLAILRESLLRTTNDTNKGFRLNVGSGLPGFLGTIQDGLNSILKLGPAAIPILAGVAVAVLAIVTYLGSLITELSAAGIGIAAFAAFALPTFMGIVSGIQAVSGAATATAKNAAWAAIPKALQPAVQAGLQLKGAFVKLVTAMQPTAVKVFGDALKVVHDLLPQLLPIALNVGKAIDGLLRGFDGFVKSAGFKSFMAQMDALAGPAVTAIGKGIGQVALALGQLITAGTGPDGLMLLSGTFTVLAGAIRGIAGAVRLSQAALFGFVGILIKVGGVALKIAQTITDSFLSAVGTIANIAAKIPGPWQGAMKKIAASIDGARASADNFFADQNAKLDQMQNNIANARLTYVLKGDMTDLQNKVAASKASLASVPKSEDTRILADISQAESQIAAIRAALDALQGTSVNTYVNVIQTSPVQGPHASGGPMMRSGMTLVGEQGPELVSLPAGSYVHSNAVSRSMMSGGGGDSYSVTVICPPNANKAELGRVTVEAIREFEKRSGKGWRS